MKKNIKSDGDTVEQTITTIFEETTIKQRKLGNDNTFRHDFDLSARKFIDWIDSIERILADKETNSLKSSERQDIIQVNIFISKFYSNHFHNIF